MKTSVKILIIATLAVAAAGPVALKQGKDSPRATATAAADAPAKDSGTKDAPVASAKLPKLVDLGAGKCIPCKMMAPILEELKKEYAGKLTVEFIDVWQNPEAGEKYGIELIPTQIFYDAQGKERFRHTGFYGKQDILRKWKELGVDLSGKASGVISFHVKRSGLASGNFLERLESAAADTKAADSFGGRVCSKGPSLKGYSTGRAR